MNALSKYNTFFSIDIEGNSVYDVTENGVSNHYMNAIATTVIFGTTATWDVWDDGNIQVGNLTNNAPANNGNRIMQSGFYNETALLWANNLQAAGPSSMPLSGISHLWAGVAGVNATGSGGELDIFSAFIGATADACFWQNSSGGYVKEACLGPISTFPSMEVTTNVTNGPGFQTVAAAACTMTAGAIGNGCVTTITFTSAAGVAQAGGNYQAVCQASGGTGVWTTGNITATTSASLSLNLIALSTSGTSTGGYVICSLTHL